MNRRGTSLAAVALVVGLAGSASTARADTPLRTGWWNTATVAGTALPSSTAPHDLRISVGPAGTLAFAAVRFETALYGSAVLVLHVASGSEVGTPAVLACPTRDDHWQAGGNQPSSSAPSYDCAGRAVSAVVGADSTGTTLSFLLDATSQLTPGVTSLALLPAAGNSAPFSLDLVAPERRALTAQPLRPTAPPAAVGATPGAVAAPPPSGGGGVVGQPLTASLPLLPPGASPDLGLAPVLAPNLAAAPLALAGPTVVPPSMGGLIRGRALVPSRARSDAAVLLVLVLAGLGYALIENRPAPLRLLGGRARATDGPLDTASQLDTAGPVRGLGRFARPRSVPARRLS